MCARVLTSLEIVREWRSDTILLRRDLYMYVYVHTIVRAAVHGERNNNCQRICKKKLLTNY